MFASGSATLGRRPLKKQLDGKRSDTQGGWRLRLPCSLEDSAHWGAGRLEAVWRLAFGHLGRWRQRWEGNALSTGDGSGPLTRDPCACWPEAREHGGSGEDCFDFVALGSGDTPRPRSPRALKCHILRRSDAPP
jgi:hypothetical protein